MEENILELFYKKDEIKTKEIEINNNILKLDKETIQLRNISQISVDKPQEKISNKVWGAILLSFIIGGFIKSIAIIIILFCIGYVALVFYKNKNARYCLSIYLNYGGKYHIFIKDELFLEKIREVLEECFNNMINGATINIEKQIIEKQIKNSSITVGDNNTVGNNNTVQNGAINNINSNNKTVNNKTDNSSNIDIKNSNISESVFGDNNKQTFVKEKNIVYDWSLLENEFKEILIKLPKSSEEYDACEDMLDIVEVKNKKLFNKRLIKYKKQFTSQLFLSTASTILSKIILDIIGVSN